MSKRPITDRAVVQALSSPLPATSLSPGPGTKSTNPKAALRRCCAAWQRAFDGSVDSDGQPNHEIFAAVDAGNAYRNAMPLLSGVDGVRDFIACTAHGILIGAIPPESSGQVLYAAQVALSFLQYQRKPLKSTPGKLPKSNSK